MTVKGFPNYQPLIVIKVKFVLSSLQHMEQIHMFTFLVSITDLMFYLVNLCHPKTKNCPNGLVNDSLFTVQFTKYLWLLLSKFPPHSDNTQSSTLIIRPTMF